MIFQEIVWDNNKVVVDNNEFLGEGNDNLYQLFMDRLCMNINFRVDLILDFITITIMYILRKKFQNLSIKVVLHFV